jgi:hypothetical protein
LGCLITTDFPMPNYQYDCTSYSYSGEKVKVCETNRGADVFSPICIGERTEKNGEFVFYTLEDLLASRDLLRKHITLKIDCEGGEWPGFKYFPVEFLDYVDSILM